ncbi:MAG: VPLPA-CTERM sorting domain-containing protein [Pseudomonadota bacterium]
MLKVTALALATAVALAAAPSSYAATYSFDWSSTAAKKKVANNGKVKYRAKSSKSAYTVSGFIEYDGSFDEAFDPSKIIDMELKVKGKKMRKLVFTEEALDHAKTRFSATMDGTGTLEVTDFLLKQKGVGSFGCKMAACERDNNNASTVIKRAMKGKKKKKKGFRAAKASDALASFRFAIETTALTDLYKETKPTPVPLPAGGLLLVGGLVGLAGLRRLRKST